jgi:hypothetical protein
MNFHHADKEYVVADGICSYKAAWLCIVSDIFDAILAADAAAADAL